MNLYVFFWNRSTRKFNERTSEIYNERRAAVIAEKRRRLPPIHAQIDAMYLDFDERLGNYNKEIFDRVSWTTFQKKSTPIEVGQSGVIGDCVEISMECVDVFEKSLAQFYSKEACFGRGLMLFSKIERTGAESLRKGDPVFITGQVLDVVLHQEARAFPEGVLRRNFFGMFPDEFRSFSYDYMIARKCDDRFLFGKIDIYSKGLKIENRESVLFFRKPNEFCGETEFDLPKLRKELPPIFSD